MGLRHLRRPLSPTADSRCEPVPCPPAVRRRLRTCAWSILLVAALSLSHAGTASAYVECGDTAGPAHNVTAVRVSCSDARAFARKVARREVTRSQLIALPGWHPYNARVRRVRGEYDVRATRGSRVIRFQYRRGGGGGGDGCDPNYAGGCLDPSSYDYDCAGGSGDGPDYTGRVRVVGDDHFDLDRDGDGIACDIS
jgi:hypothetical protein